MAMRPVPAYRLNRTAAAFFRPRIAGYPRPRPPISFAQEGLL